MTNAIKLGFGAVALMVTSVAQAAYNGPLLTKTTNSGFVPPGHRMHTRCEIHRDKVVLTLGSENVRSTQERVITLEGGLDAAIAQAAEGPIVEESAPTDGPGSVYLAKRVLPNDAVETITLLQYTGGDGKLIENRSAAARGLRNFLDMHCR